MWAMTAYAFFFAWAAAAVVLLFGWCFGVLNPRVAAPTRSDEDRCHS